MKAAAVLFLVVTASTAAGAAQDVPGIVQLSEKSDSIDVGDQLTKAGGEAPRQISANSDRAPTAAQLTSADSSNQQPRQLTSVARTAQAAPPLSSPADGRIASIERVEGADRCDASLPREKQSGQCSRVIESRADEYRRPSPTQLTPEQRLMVDQQLRDADENLADATRRLARTGQPDSSPESLGIASIALAQTQHQQQPQQEPEKPDDLATQAIVDAILQTISQAPPN